MENQPEIIRIKVPHHYIGCGCSFPYVLYLMETTNGERKEVCEITIPYCVACGWLSHSRLHVESLEIISQQTGMKLCRGTIDNSLGLDKEVRQRLTGNDREKENKLQLVKKLARKEMRRFYLYRYDACDASLVIALCERVDTCLICKKKFNFIDNQVQVESIVNYFPIRTKNTCTVGVYPSHFFDKKGNLLCITCLKKAMAEFRQEMKWAARGRELLKDYRRVREAMRLRNKELQHQGTSSS